MSGNKFDVIFLGEVLEHFLDTDFILKECRDALKPRGVALITAPNLTSFENRLRAVLGYHPRFMDFRTGPNSICHCRYYTLSKLTSQLQGNSFDILRSYTINASLLTRTREIRLPKFLNRLGFGTTIFVVAKVIKD